jgi:hypothetical protein
MAAPSDTFVVIDYAHPKWGCTVAAFTNYEAAEKLRAYLVQTVRDEYSPEFADAPETRWDVAQMGQYRDAHRALADYTDAQISHEAFVAKQKAEANGRA